MVVWVVWFWVLVFFIFPFCRSGAEFLVIVTRAFFSQADIMDINEIFKDLGMMIHEQGDVIGKPHWGGSRLHAVYLR